MGKTWEELPEIVSLNDGKEFFIQRQGGPEENHYHIVFSKYKYEIQCQHADTKRMVKVTFDPIYRFLIFGRDEVDKKTLQIICGKLALLENTLKTHESFSMGTIIKEVSMDSTDFLKEIVELSDCQWIRERWSPMIGDLVCARREIRLSTLQWSDIKRITHDTEKFELAKTEYIYIPITLNPETCRLQIDDLLLEANDIKPDCEVYTKQNMILNSMYVGYLKESGLIDEDIPEILVKLRWLKKVLQHDQCGGASSDSKRDILEAKKD